MRFRDAAFHTVEEIGATRSLTPEGFLLCKSVPIARTGMMLYGAGEITAADGEDALEAGDDGLIRVERSETDVFAPETIASFLGKPVTDDHPDDAVTPLTFREVQIGTTHNVRRGDGVYSDCLVADLLIMDADAIRAVQDGKREISCGYDADYEQSAPGRARQFNIIGNHVALVDRGRCGPRCAIGDRDMATKDKKPTWLDRLTTRLRASTGTLTADAVIALAKDAEKEDEDEKKKGEEAKTTDARLSKIESTLDGLPGTIAAAIKDAMGGSEEEEEEGATTQDEDGDEDEEGKKKPGDTKDAATAAATRDARTIDSKTMRDVMQTIRAQAEILAPGHDLRLPTADGKPAKAVAFADSMCNCKRKALDVAYRTEAGRAAIDPFLNGRTADFARMNAKTIDVIFTGAAVLRGQRNNDNAARGIRPNVTRDDFGAAPLTNDALNKAHADFWSKNGGTAQTAIAK